MRIRCLIHLPQFCRSHYIKLFFRNKMSGVSLNNITLCILLSVNNIVQFFYRFLWLWFHDTAVVLLTEHFSLCLTKPVFYLSCIKCVFLTKPKTNLKEKLACYFDARGKRGKYCTKNCNGYYVHLYNCTVLQLSVGGKRYCTINCIGYYVYLYNCTVLQLSLGGKRCCTINCIGYYVYLYNCTVLQLSMGWTRCCTIYCNGYCVLLHSCCASNVCWR